LSIQALLQMAIKQGLSRLDADILLSYVLGADRVYLYTWPDNVPSQSHIQQFLSLVETRLTGMPIAYLVGQKEFWSLMLDVTTDVLIPRPETELIVEIILKLLPNNDKQRLLELGTGSGAISLALAIEQPNWHFMATDLSPEALAVAKKNAKNLSIGNIEFKRGDWFDALSPLPDGEKFFNSIISNPPYIADHDPHLQSTDIRFEPSLALQAGADGLRDLKKIIEKAPMYLAPKGWLVLEHGIAQKSAVFSFFQEQKFTEVETYKDLAGANRVTIGRKG
jgi:release factor glutamine methyltransferase